MAGVTVRAITTIKRGGIYITPGTVFDMPDQKSADHLIARGVVSPYLEKAIVAVPEYEINVNAEAEAEVNARALEAPPESFTESPRGNSPADDRGHKGRRR